MLLEDIDTAGITHTRGKAVVPDATRGKNAALAKDDGDDNSIDDVEDVTAADDSKRDGITLSGLLNVIDGVAASEGRILVMTTNHPEKLDAALLRPGRVDMSIEFGYARGLDIEKLFSSIYITMEGDPPRKSSSTRPHNDHFASSTNGNAIKGDSQDGQRVVEMEKQTVNEQKEEEEKERVFLRARITELGKEFAFVVPGGEFTAAEIQGYLLNHKDSPEAAIIGAGAWVESVREQKRFREEKHAV